jgi:hypothetical protein
MSASFTGKVRQVTLVLAIATISSLYASQSFAYTAEQQRMCTGDAFKFCSADIPNVSAITACMYKHRSELSAGCRAVMDKEAANKPKTVANQQ